MSDLFGFIGTGNMGGALAEAACKGVGGSRVLLTNRTVGKAEALAAALGCAVGENRTAAEKSKYLFLGVKPQMMEELLRGIAPVLAARTDRFVLVTMAAGLSMKRISAMTGGDYPVIRIMPNTPVSIGEGMMLYTVNELVTAEEEQAFLDAMAPAGRFDRLDEGLIDAGSAVSGCGPAFVYLFLEALADGGVRCGLPRAKALEYAAQTLRGAATLALESGAHPGALKDAVCSPGGTTIAGVEALEQGAFRGTAMGAVTAAYRRTLELAK